VSEAAAGIYRVTQPYRYAFSRPPEAAAERERVLTELAADASEEERKWALSGLSAHYRMMGDYARAAEFARRALEIDPKLIPAIGNVALAEYQQGHDEAMLASTETFLRLWRRGSLDDYDARVVALNGFIFETTQARRLGSPAAMREAARKSSAQGASSFTAGAAATEVDAAILARDYPAAMAAVGRISGTPLLAAQAAALAARVRFHQAVEERHAGRARAAAAEVLAMAEKSTAALPAGIGTAEIRIFRLPQLAIGLGQIGLGADAAALAKDLPADCYDCVRARGWAALASGNRSEARRWFEEAVRQGPSVPMGHADLANLALLERNPAAALAHLEEASRSGPNWADPIKYRADIAAAQGRTREALDLYRQAVRLTPGWGRLQLDLGTLLHRLGRADEAAPHLRAAASGALSGGAAERLAALTNGRRSLAR
jgi:tetratricopeptide (TPR) repeat protein